MDRKRSKTAHEARKGSNDLNWKKIKTKFFKPENVEENIAVLFDPEVLNDNFKKSSESEKKITQITSKNDFEISTPKGFEESTKSPKNFKEKVMNEHNNLSKKNQK